MTSIWTKRLHYFLLILFCVFPSFPALGSEVLDIGEGVPVSESGPTPRLGFETDFVSRYVWRGIALSQGPVLQPSMWVSLYGATLSIWGNFVLGDEPNQGQLNEVDFDLGYHYQYKRLIVQPLLLFYLFPHQNVSNTGSAALAIGVKLGSFKLFTAQYFDVIQAPGSYFALAGVSFERELHPKLSLKTSMSFGWANSKFNQVNLQVPQAAANLLAWNLNLNWYVHEPFYLRPHLQVSALLDKDLRHSVADPTIVSGGLALGVDF